MIARRVQAWLFPLGLVTVAALAGCSTGPGVAGVQFNQSMAAHHAQAVQLALTGLECAPAGDLRAMLTDIVLTQQNQIGRMQAALEGWGAPLAPSDPHPMPGMATGAQLARLSESEGPERDQALLRLMISHHQAGVQMAEAALAAGLDPASERLARSMAGMQRAELQALAALQARVDGATWGSTPGCRSA